MTRQQQERKIDEAAADSFPASDPPSHSGITGVGHPPPDTKTPDRDKARPPSHERGTDARPTGLPTSDRHATETAHGWEDEAGTER